MTEKQTENNMAIWEQVCETDPKLTTPVKIGGWEFTSPDPQPQLKRATKLWGPYGAKWGVENLQYEYIRENDVIIEIALTADFFYPYESIKISFPISTDISFRFSSTKGLTGDTHKKLLTDLRSKALSLVGFNSDVFEGKFGNPFQGDNKYVMEMRERFSGKGAKNPKPPAAKSPSNSKSRTSGGEVTHASPALLEEMNELLASRDVPEKAITEVKSRAGVDSWINLTTEQTQKIITWVNKKYPATAGDEIPFDQGIEL